jgi:hypothetical protein
MGDVHVKVRGNLTSMIRKNKQEVHIIMNMHRPPVEGSFCNEHRKTKKPMIFEDYSQQIGYIHNGDRMANSYILSMFITTCIWKIYCYYFTHYTRSLDKFWDAELSEQSQQIRMHNLIAQFLATRLVPVKMSLHIVSQAQKGCSPTGINRAWEEVMSCNVFMASKVVQMRTSLSSFWDRLSRAMLHHTPYFSD